MCHQDWCCWKTEEWHHTIVYRGNSRKLGLVVLPSQEYDWWQEILDIESFVAEWYKNYEEGRRVATGGRCCKELRWRVCLNSKECCLDQWAVRSSLRKSLGTQNLCKLSVKRVGWVKLWRFFLRLATEWLKKRWDESANSRRKRSAICHFSLFDVRKGSKIVKCKMRINLFIT